jgi:hypothetical protein
MASQVGLSSVESVAAEGILIWTTVIESFRSVHLCLYDAVILHGHINLLSVKCENKRRQG